MSREIMFGQFNTALAAIGAAATAYFSLKILLFIIKSLKMFVLRLGANPKIYGSWAVVTGATDGIGKAYAEQLASKGLNVVLMSRTKAKLKDVAAKIESKYKVETKIVAVDFSGGAEIYKSIGKELKDLEIGVLVNNVGMAYPYPQYFHELEDFEKLVPALINCNCLAATMMINAILPSMRSRKKGLIVNISSASGDFPSPLLTVYSATKAYMDFLSRALHSEYSSEGIIVQSVLPFFVATKLSKIRRSSLTVPTAPSYAASALATVGIENRTFGCFVHNLQGAAFSLVPGSLRTSLGTALFDGVVKQMKEAAMEERAAAAEKSE